MSITSPADLNGVNGLTLRWAMLADDAADFVLTGSDVDQWKYATDPTKKWTYDTTNGTVKAQRLTNRTPSGLPAVVFPGTGRNRYTGPSMTAANSVGASMFMILKRGSDVSASFPTGKRGFYDFSTFGTNARWDTAGGGHDMQLLYNFGNDLSGWVSSYANPSLGWHSFIQVNTSATGQDVYLNGVLGWNGGGIPNSFPSTPVFGEDTSTNVFYGEVLEMWFFTGTNAFTSTMIADLETYKTTRLGSGGGGGATGVRSFVAGLMG